MPSEQETTPNPLVPNAELASPPADTTPPEPLISISQPSIEANAQQAGEESAPPAAEPMVTPPAPPVAVADTNVETPEETPEAVEPPEAETPPAVVPLARLQGVQRQLSQVQKDAATAQAQVADLTTQLATANTRAAHEYAERMRSTSRDLVPSLISGDTIEAVEQSITASRAAYAAAQAHYARTIPVPQPGNPSAPNTPDQRSPAQLISAGLRQATNPNINQ